MKNQFCKFKKRKEYLKGAFTFWFRILQKAQDTGYININCVDPLGRSALLMAIDNENLEMVELLIEYKVDTKDALLHAISEEFVEAVEVLLEHEESCRHKDEPHVSVNQIKFSITILKEISKTFLVFKQSSY